MNEQDDDLIYLTPDTTITRAEQLALIPPPALRIEFRVMESWNTFISSVKHYGAMQGLIKRLRKAGARKGVFYGRRLREPVKTYEGYEFFHPPLFYRCAVNLRYWSANWTTYDVFNPLVKPIIDGFVDVNIVDDDSQKHIPSFAVEFMGVDARLKLSDEAKIDRKVKSKGRAKSLPMPARYWFDFYRL